MKYRGCIQTEIRDLEDLFVYDLEVAYDMEVKLVDTLDDMSRTVTNDNLNAGFAIHCTETEKQIHLVEEAFEGPGRNQPGETAELPTVC